MIHAPAPLRHLTLTPDGRGGWRITRAGGPDPAQALVGRAPAEAARLVPLVFNLCGAAHGLAAAAALGLPPAASTRAMAQEIVRDHALAMLHVWPHALGETPDRAGLALLALPGGETDFARTLAGDAANLAEFSPAELDAWLDAAPTGTARRLGRIRREVDPALGRAGLPPLAARDIAADITAALHRPPGAAAQATSLLRETGALARVAATPLMAALLAREGESLFARLLARLVDCLRTLAGVVEPPAALPEGLGVAHAARGLLVHAARVEAGRIAAYRILSPSAWNCAPGGLLERAFAALPSGVQGRRLAPLLVSAINPCVPVTFAEEPADA